MAAAAAVDAMSLSREMAAALLKGAASVDVPRIVVVGDAAITDKVCGR